MGKTPTLSGKVYEDTSSYKAYTGGDLTVIAENGVGRGTIKGGQLSITLGTPTSLDNLESLDFIVFDGFTASPSNAKGWCFWDLDIAGSDYSFCGRINITNSGTSNTSEYVGYFYIDKDVTISREETKSYYQGNPETYKAFSFTLQAGWNTVYYKGQYFENGGTSSWIFSSSLCVLRELCVRIFLGKW